MNTSLILKAIGNSAANRIKQRIKQNRVKPATKKSNKKGQSGTTLVQSGHLVNSISSQITGNQIEVGTNLKYAKIHHFGGIINQTVTTRQRKFFWAMYYETNNEMWKFSALAKNINIPITARPYMYLDSGDISYLRNQIGRMVKKGIENGL